MSKAEDQQGEVKVPQPEASLSSERCPAAPFQPPLRAGLLEEDGGSYGHPLEERAQAFACTARRGQGGPAALRGRH